MAAINPEVALRRSRLAIAHRRHDAVAVVDAQRDLAAANIAAFVERTVAAAPPLTAEQRDRLALLLRPTASSGDAA